MFKQTKFLSMLSPVKVLLLERRNFSEVFYSFESFKLFIFLPPATKFLQSLSALLTFQLTVMSPLDLKSSLFVNIFMLLKILIFNEETSNGKDFRKKNLKSFPAWVFELNETFMRLKSYLLSFYPKKKLKEREKKT